MWCVAGNSVAEQAMQRQNNDQLVGRLLFVVFLLIVHPNYKADRLQSSGKLRAFYNLGNTCAGPTADSSITVIIERALPAGLLCYRLLSQGSSAGLCCSSPGPCRG